MKRIQKFGLLTLALLVTVMLFTGCSGKQQTTPQVKPEPAQQDSKKSDAKPAQDNKETEKAPTGTKSDKLEKVVIANPVLGLVFLPVYWGIEKGYFAAEGLDVQLVETKTNILVSGMASGDIHYGTSVGTIARAAIQGMPVRNVAYVALKPDFVLVSQKSIEDVKGLKGKVVASSNPTATSTVALMAALKHFGMSEKDVTLQYISGSSDRMAALAGKSIDAAVLTMPYEIIAEREGLRDLFFAGSVMDIPFSGLGTSTQRIKENPEQVKKVIKVFMRGIQDIQKDKAGITQFITKTWKIDEQGATKEYEKLLSMISKNGMAPESSILADAKAMQEQLKISTQEIKITDVVDFSLLKEVQKELGL